MEACGCKSAICRGTQFVKANLKDCDFSHADLSGADMTLANLFRTKLHQIIEESTIWTLANKEAALGTDPELAAGEQWQPAI
jgi:uncharacterized protein YjbI with pentapeptide repeats